MMKILVFGTALLSTLAMASPVQNFGQNLTPLQNAFANKRVHILQLGDSHTAGDYFTETLRKRLQADIGDGGIGFAYPAKLSGQRSARHGYGASEYTVYNSRKQSFDFPLGGVAAVSNGGSMTLTSSTYQGDSQQASIVVRGNAGDKVALSDKKGGRVFALPKNGWQVLNDTLTFPVNVRADSGVSLGGFWLRRPSGGVVSAMGINGATQSYWNKWRVGVSEDLANSVADLVILAYGTNEAFANTNPSHKQAVQTAINQIRQGLPNAVILLINAPDSLKSTAGSCGTPPPSLSTVRNTLYELAKDNGTLYWDWQAAMGGACSMKAWIERGLGAKDGVHFSAKGYEMAANDLYDNLRPLLVGGSVADSNKTNTRRYVSTTPKQPLQTGWICMNGVCSTL